MSQPTWWSEPVPLARGAFRFQGRYGGTDGALEPVSPDGASIPLSSLFEERIGPLLEVDVAGDRLFSQLDGGRWAETWPGRATIELLCDVADAGRIATGLSLAHLRSQAEAPENLCTMLLERLFGASLAERRWWIAPASAELAARLPAAVGMTSASDLLRALQSLFGATTRLLHGAEDPNALEVATPLRTSNGHEAAPIAGAPPVIGPARLGRPRVVVQLPRRSLRPELLETFEEHRMSSATHADEPPEARLVRRVAAAYLMPHVDVLTKRA